MKSDTSDPLEVREEWVGGNVAAVFRDWGEAGALASIRSVRGFVSLPSGRTGIGVSIDDQCASVICGHAWIGCAATLDLACRLVSHGSSAVGRSGRMSPCRSGARPLAPQLFVSSPIITHTSVETRQPMTLVFLMAFGWLSLRTLLLVAQVNRHSPESRLGRAFQQELRRRGLITGPADSERLLS